MVNTKIRKISHITKSYIRSSKGKVLDTLYEEGYYPIGLFKKSSIVIKTRLAAEMGATPLVKKDLFLSSTKPQSPCHLHKA